MKRTQLKDALRNIWKQKISFLSIVVIAALGVTMFLGIDFSADAVRKNASAFYNQNNYRDIELISTLLLSENDLNAIRSTEGVSDVEGVYMTDARASANDARAQVQVLTLTQRINLPVLYAGRLPASGTECAVEQDVAVALGLEPGDTIAVTNGKGDTAQYLRQTAFVVTGILMHPDHICTTIPATPYLLVTEDAFDTEALNGCCMKAVLVIDRAADVGRFDAAYYDSVGAVLARIEALGTTRSALREAEMHTQAEDTLAGYRDEIADGEQQLANARAELDQGYIDLEDGERQYADGEQELKDARAQLDDARQQLADGKQELTDARAELDDAKAELDAGAEELSAAKELLDSARKQLVYGWNQIENAKEEIRSALRDAIENVFGAETADLIRWANKQSANPDSKSAKASDFWITEDCKITLDSSKTLQEQIQTFVQSDAIPDAVLEAVFYYVYPEGTYDAQTARTILYNALAEPIAAYDAAYLQLASGCNRWDRGHRSYLNGKAQYEDGLAQYEEGLQAYNDGEAQYTEGLQQYEEALQTYSDGESEYEQGVIDLADARAQLDDARQQLADGEAQYEDGLRELEDAKAQLSEAEEQIASIGPCKWIVADVTGNASFMQLDTAGNNLKSLVMTFSLLFVLVGALVIYATISKMVDEQRSLVGTTKALGFFRGEILLKYLLFGVSATLLGAVLGLILAATAIQFFTLNGYDPYFTIDLLPRVVKGLPTAAVFAASVLLAVAAIWFAARKLMKESAIRLMQAAVPRGTKKKTAGKKSALPLYSRLILLNIRTDLRRVLVTVASVAGCCALVVIGVTLRQAVSGAEQKQFDEIVRYSGTVQFDPEADSSAAEDISARIAQAGGESVPFMHTYVTIRIKNLDMQELYCGDLNAISEMFALKDAKTGEPIEPTDDGVYVSRRFTELFGLNLGDSFAITLNGTETVEVRIVGVFENYMGRYLFMTDDCFRSLFGKDAEPNMFYVKLNGTDSETLIASLRSTDSFLSYESTDGSKALFSKATSVLNGVVLLFIGMAAVMAGVVLMNLTNIYVMQKKRELTIMRINGFTTREVIGYMLQETVVTTAAGVLLGMALGSGIGYRIVRSLEQSFIQFDRSISCIAWLIGAAITIVFTVVVNAIALRKVRQLKLTDV